MKNKNKYILLLFFFTLFLSFRAQVSDKRDKIQTLKVAYINQKVHFTSEEAKVFWPLYNEYNDKLETYKSVFKEKQEKMQGGLPLNENEAETFLNAAALLKQKEYELYKEYYDKFKKILPLQKVATLRWAEDEFKKELVKNIKRNSSE